jgi:hypothetical protein
MSLFHGHEGIFVKRLKILNRERIKKYEKILFKWNSDNK